MSIISTPKENFCRYNFIFSGKEIILKSEWKAAEENHQQFKTSFLPDLSDVEKFLKNQVVADWFNETELDYSAFKLEQDAVLPSNLISIPLRHFFWITKDASETNTFNSSDLTNLASRAYSLLEQRNLYRFCPSCGSKLFDSPDFTAKKCAVCGREFFPRLEPAIIVLVKKGDEILLVKNKKHTAGNYSCVAGFVEAGENAEQCVKREVLEETGISVCNIQYAGTQSWPFPDQLMLAYTADYLSGDIKIQESELTDAQWFKKDCLPKLPNPGSVAFNLISSFLCKFN